MQAKSARRTAKPAARAAVDGDPYAARAMDSLRRIVHSLRVATRASERSFGLSAAQHFVLRQLALEPGQSLIDLARRTRTTQSSVSEVVSRLVKRELVSRRTSDTDRRRTELSLTPAGDAVLRRSPETVQEATKSRSVIGSSSSGSSTVPSACQTVSRTVTPVPPPTSSCRRSPTACLRPHERGPLRRPGPTDALPPI